jgi:1,2-diacylglycerol 3-beta-glucosyltransferase
MTAAVQAITLALLLGWPVYNVGIALLAFRPTRGPRSAADPGPLEFWIMIPALNEAKVIATTATAALALHTPETPVRVLVVDDGSDDETPGILAGLAAHPRLTVLRRDPPHARQGKGEALNAGYRAIRAMAATSGTTRSTVVGVVDGDGRGDQVLLHEVRRLFADRAVGAVQCRVRITNRQHLLGLLQDIEFACVANASQSLRDRLDSVGMGGNGQFVRLSDLARLGDSPWSSCLVEDLELGLRLHLAGVVIRYTSRASMSQQAVVEPRRLLRQRTRWAQGNLQCARYVRQLSESRHIGSLGLLDFLVYLASPWTTIPMTLLVLAASGLAVVGLTTGETFGGILAGQADTAWVLTLWLGTLFAPGLIWGIFHWWRIGDVRLRRCLLAGLCYPAFLLLGIAATWSAVGRHVRGRRGWVKTERTDDAAAGAVPEPPTVVLEAPVPLPRGPQRVGRVGAVAPSREGGGPRPPMPRAG